MALEFIELVVSRKLSEILFEEIKLEPKHSSSVNVSDLVSSIFILELYVFDDIFSFSSNKYFYRKQ